MTSSPPSPLTSSSRLDSRLILEQPLRQFAPWLVVVLAATWAGYPGVVCITPLAWLMALRVGIVCVSRSTSQPASRRVQEAALGGAWFGLLQGLLFLVIIPRLGPIQEGERGSAVLLTLAMIVFGMIIGAGLSAFTASQIERRRRANQAGLGSEDQ
jgi:MFS family permease